MPTRVRTENALEQLQKYGGRNWTGPDGAPAPARAIRFCVSQRHADSMAESFRKKGLRADAAKNTLSTRSCLQEQGSHPCFG